MDRSGNKYFKYKVQQAMESVRVWVGINDPIFFELTFQT